VLEEDLEQHAGGAVNEVTNLIVAGEVLTEGNV